MANSAKKSVAASGAATATFSETSNNVDVTKVGYMTKASENLPFRVLCMGPVTDKDGNIVKDENGDVSYGYISDHPVLEYHPRYEGEEVFDQINKEGKFIEAGFGMAHFPTCKRSKTGTDMLGMISRNCRELGVDPDNFIHGEIHPGDEKHPNDDYSSYSYFLAVGSGMQFVEMKGHPDAIYPVWTTKKPVV